MPASYPDSWYVASARGLVSYPLLEGEQDTDVCVVGGGFTGLSAALHLAESGYRVILLEANRIAWGASGRNGGQVASGQRRSEEDLEREFGRADALKLFGLAEEAKALVRARVSRHAIDCDLRHGQLIVADRPREGIHLMHRAERLATRYGYSGARHVPPAELTGMLGSRAFHGGLLDDGALHLHPLNFALGLARAATAAGVRIFEGSEASSPGTASAPRVLTAAGAVRASHVVLACDAYLGRLEPRIASRMMPINNFIIATEVLGETAARELIRDDVCVHDTRHVVNYFRRSADHRLLFGGGENYGGGFPADIRAFVQPHMLRVFPQLRGARIDYGWGGALGVTRTRMPHVGRLGPDLFFAQGFSGHGISIGLLAGKLIAEAVAGTAERFDLMARVAPPAFPGGTLLRWPLLVLGMLYYALLDRL